MGLGTASADAAQIEVPLAVALPIGQPSAGRTTLRVPLPTRVQQRAPDHDAAAGFTIACTGSGRWAEVVLAYDLAPVPAHLPEALGCTVGPHTVTIRLTNDLEVARGDAAVALVLRIDQGFAAFPVAAGAEGPGRVSDLSDGAVAGLGCRIEKGLLWADVRPGLAPGAYRCRVEGREPVLIDVVPGE